MAEEREQQANGPASGSIALSSLPLRNLRLIEELGTGSHGTVYLAEILEETLGLPQGERVAVKFLRQSLLSDPRWVARFRREAEIGRRTRHPNVIRIHGLEEVEILGLPLLYLVMEFVAGQTLRQVLGEDDVAAGEALVRRVGQEAAQGLAALHAQGVVHRDVKPENLYLTSDGVTKVMDLGFARRGGVAPAVRYTPSDRPGTVAGSLAYGAPECLRGRPASASSDLYALGVVLYELAAGRHPFFARDAAIDADVVIDRQLHQAPAPPSTWRPRLSPFLDRLILDLLAKEPRQRPRNAETVARILELGERSPWWQRHEKETPLLLSDERLRRSRRPAVVPFADRRAELAILEQALARARRGQPQVVHVTGVEGAGKRRLIDELVAGHLRTGPGLLYLAGEPVSRSHDEPLSPLGTFLIEAWTRQDLADDTDLPAPGTSARWRLGERLAVRLARGAALEPTAARALVRHLLPGRRPDLPLPVDAAAQAVCALGRPDVPVVLRVHQAERLEPGVLAVLERLVTGDPPAHVLVLLTSHTESRPIELAFPHERLELHALEEGATVELLGRLFARDQDVAAAARWLGARMATMPGLILDMLEILRQQGNLRGEPGAYFDLVEGADVPLRGMLESYLTAAFDRLTGEERELLQAAAVLGLRFRSDDLAATLGVPDLEVLQRLSRLKDRWVLFEGSQFRFRRRSQRQLVQGRTDPQRRIDLHARAAAALAARGAPPLPVALLWSRATAHGRALPLLLGAAADFLARGEIERAGALLRRAQLHLTALPPGDERTGLEARWRDLRIEHELVAGRPAAARELAARGIADGAAPPENAARWRVLMARAARDQGFYGQALDEVSAALPALAPGSDERVKALLMQAELHNMSGQLRRALVVAAQAHGILLERGDRASSLYARATMDLARLEAARLHVETAERRFDETETLLERQGETLGLVWLALRRARLWLDLGRNTEVRRALEEMVVAEPRERARAQHLVGVAWFQDGDFERALELCLEAEATARAAGDVFGGLGIRVSRLEAEVELGRGTLEACEAIRTDAERSRLPRQVLRAERLAARVLREAGDPEAALERVRQALEQVRSLSIEPTVVLGVWLEKALTLTALGRDEEAKRARLHARRYLERLAARFPQRRDRQRFLKATPIRRALTALSRHR